MTRILTFSDTHLEQSYWDFLDSYPDFDVVVVAGDLDSPLQNSVRRLARATQGGPFKGKPVVLVPGNHEYYRVDLEATFAAALREADAYGINLLDGDECVVEGVRFLGATLWTDYALDGDVRGAMATAAEQMNDHELIATKGRKFRPSDALAIHRRKVAWLASRLRTGFEGQTVVVTHHGPSPGSVHAKYRHDPLNPAFSSDLEALIHETGPDLWIHGHTHSSFDYTVGRTRVVCNPKGYGPTTLGGHDVENAFGFVEDLILDLSPVVT